MSLDEFQENARRYGGRRRNEKNVGRTDLRGNYYDASFFAFRARIGSLKKRDLLTLGPRQCANAGTS